MREAQAVPSAGLSMQYSSNRSVCVLHCLCQRMLTETATWLNFIGHFMPRSALPTGGIRQSAFMHPLSITSKCCALWLFRPRASHRALRIHIERIERMACRHEQAVLVDAAETQVGATFRKRDPA